MTAHKWQPLKQANLIQTLTDADVQFTMERGGYDEATARRLLEEEVWGIEYWINDIYQVAKRQLKRDDGTPIPMVQLNIRRRDGKVIFRDWRHFQWIKNQLVGEECEGFEVYPAESRLVDTSNKYHIFCFTDAKFRIPTGMNDRDVFDDDGTRTPGYRQRKL